MRKRYDVGETVAELVAHLFGLDDHLERLRLGSTRRQRIDVHRGASAECGQEQLDRSEVAAPVADHDDRAAAVVGG